MKKYLIVYYSRSGHTEAVALKLKDLLEQNAETEKLIDKKKRDGVFGFLSSALDALTNKIVPIENIKKQPEHYEEVILLSPIWAGKIAPPCRTYMEINRESIRKISIITLSMRSNAEAVAQNILKRYGLRAEHVISIKDTQIKNDEYKAIIEAARF